MKIVYVMVFSIFLSGCTLISDINRAITINKISEPTQVKKTVPKTQVKKKQERIQNNTPKMQERQSIKREV